MVFSGAELVALADGGNPRVTGPIPGIPTIVPAANFTGYDFVEEEFFVEGMATSFVNVVPLPLNPNGHWTVAPNSSASYKTRILVRRPATLKRFNGVVVVEWFNVSGLVDAGTDWTYMRQEMLRGGYAWVGVSAQKAGVDHLVGTNPSRYSALVHPGDSFSYDIVSQVGQLLKESGSIDPLAGMQPEVLLAAGQSQSAFRLTTYYNAVQPLAGIYDGFFIHSRLGGSAPISQPPQADLPTPSATFIRTDVPVPVLTFQTEGDLIMLGSYWARQADNKFLRFWEIAGNAHADVYLLEAAGVPDFCPGANDGPQHYVLRAALQHLVRWAQGGASPPSANFIELVSTSPTVVVARDEHGNALGGVRTPQLNVPIATYSGVAPSGAPGWCFLFGSTTPFAEDKLAELYPSHCTYVSRFNQATNDAVKAGFILKYDAQELKVKAAQSDIGK
jgi:hypothetical protein